MKPLARSIYPYLYLFFCFAIPLDRYATAVPNIIMVAMLVLFPLVVEGRHFKRLLRREILIFAALVLFVVGSNFLLHDFEADWTVLKKMLSALLLIVLFLPLEKTENLMKTLIIAVLFCIAISLANLYFYVGETEAFEFAFGPAVGEVLIIDRLYLGFLSVLSIISSTALIGRRYNDYNKWYLANIVLNVVFVLLISSRIAILLLILVLVLRVFYSSRKKQYLWFFIITLVLTAGAFSVNENLRMRFFYSHDQTDKSYLELVKTWEPRVVIWECNYRIFSNQTTEEKLLGSGYYQVKDQLVDCYSDVVTKERRRNYFKEKRFNPHNQFFDFQLSSGVVATLLFLVLFSVLLWRNRDRYYKVALVISLLAFSLIEAYFQRQMGAYFFALVLIMVLSDSVFLTDGKNREGETEEKSTNLNPGDAQT